MEDATACNSLIKPLLRGREKKAEGGKNGMEKSRKKATKTGWRRKKNVKRKKRERKKILRE